MIGSHPPPPFSSSTSHPLTGMSHMDSYSYNRHDQSSSATDENDINDTVKRNHKAYKKSLSPTLDTNISHNDDKDSISEISVCSEDNDQQLVSSSIVNGRVTQSPQLGSVFRKRTLSMTDSNAKLSVDNAVMQKRCRSMYKTEEIIKTEEVCHSMEIIKSEAHSHSYPKSMTNEAEYLSDSLSEMQTSSSNDPSTTNSSSSSSRGASSAPILNTCWNIIPSLQSMDKDLHIDINSRYSYQLDPCSEIKLSRSQFDHAMSAKKAVGLDSNPIAQDYYLNHQNQDLRIDQDRLLGGLYCSQDSVGYHNSLSTDILKVFFRINLNKKIYLD